MHKVHDLIMHKVVDVMCTIHYLGVYMYLHPPNNYFCYMFHFLSFYLPLKEFDVNVINGIAIDDADDVLLV